MAKRSRRRGGSEKESVDVLGLVAEARAAGIAALEQLRAEIAATRRRLEALAGEEKGFRLELFGTTGRPRKLERRRKSGRGRGGSLGTRRRETARAEKFFNKLPERFTLDDVRKLAGRAAAVSLAQWARGKRIKKTQSGYTKSSGGDYPGPRRLKI